jgi:acetylornithine deacetylase/succinyl-diaminopimelate desuccinylase-like protein
VDDKGQIFLHIKALEAHLATRGTLPVNVVVIVEGEEEIGSENLAAFVGLFPQLPSALAPNRLATRQLVFA